MLGLHGALQRAMTERDEDAAQSPLLEVPSSSAEEGYGVASSSSSAPEDDDEVESSPVPLHKSTLVGPHSPTNSPPQKPIREISPPLLRSGDIPPSASYDIDLFSASAPHPSHLCDEERNPAASASEDDFSASFPARSTVPGERSTPCMSSRYRASASVSKAGECGVSAAFVTAGSLLRSEILSPGFRSAAAMAGWDDEALLLAAQEEDPACLAVNATEDESLQQELVSPIVVKRSVRRHRERKREQRTPQQASTPLSAGRRSRKPRRHGIHGCSPEVLPIGDLSLKEEFRTGMSEGDARNSAVDEKNSEGEAGTSPATDAIVESSASSENGGATQEQDQSQSKPPCLEKLREELSCAVCLEICFEPSSTSCGHSFCRECLQSVLQRCGSRCPKCRQQLRGDGGRGGCQVNVVLWNTVQLLFPEEVALRKEAAAAAAAAGKEEESRVRPRRGGSEREGSGGWHSARAPVAGLLPRRGGGSSGGGSGSGAMRAVVTSITTASSSAAAARERQILADAAFARQLQIQLNVHGRREAAAAGDGVVGNVASAAANLRAVAQRAARHRLRHT